MPWSLFTLQFEVILLTSSKIASFPAELQSSVFSHSKQGLSYINEKAGPSQKICYKCDFALAPEALEVTPKAHHKTCEMKKHVCPQKWTVKVMGIYLTYPITLVCGGKAHSICF